MKVSIKEKSTGAEVSAEILPTLSNEFILEKEGWSFKWNQLLQTEGSIFFKLVRTENSEKIEGLVMLSLLFDEMLYMNNIEVAPHNRGATRIHDKVAGCLIAFACRLSHKIGRGDYQGYLSFDSKTSLIEFYQRKYGAKLAMGHRMYIDPLQAKKLRESFLGIND